MQPKVTIILPVYNVEPYLRECLDSVVNQTMREIQIICVNDGSTDGSPAILEVYAAKDPRIMIIHQANQGGGSARNAAFPHIQGKYTYFIDPDDWIDLQLCEKLFQCAEENQAEVVYLDHWNADLDGKNITYCGNSYQALSHIRNLPLRVIKENLFSIATTFRKFWNSRFLLEHQVTFVTGKRPGNDVLQNWKGLLHAQRIAVLDERLYYHRKRSGSYQNSNDYSTRYIIFQVYDEIREYLIDSGYYHQYKEFYATLKLRSIFSLYARSPMKVRGTMFKMALENFGEDERVFSRKASPWNRGTVFSGKVFAIKERRFVQFLFYSLLMFIYVHAYLLVLTVKKLVSIRSKQ